MGGGGLGLGLGLGGGGRGGAGLGLGGGRGLGHCEYEQAGHGTHRASSVLANVPGQQVVHSEELTPATCPGWQAVHDVDAKELNVPAGQPAQSPVAKSKCWPAGQLHTVAAQAEGRDGNGQVKLLEPPEIKQRARIVLTPKFEGRVPLKELLLRESVCRA